MSNTSSCLTHYNDQHIQVRKDFFDICAYDKNDFNQGLSKNGKKVLDEPNQACMAMVLRLLETLTNRNNQIWIPLSYSTIATLLYNTYSETTIRKSIAALLAKGYIFCRQETKGSVPSYTLNIAVLQSALDQQRKEYIQKATESESKAVKFDREGIKFDRGGVNVDSLGVSNLTANKKENNKITHKIFNESKNAESRQIATVTTEQEATHSSMHSSLSQSKNFSFSSSPEGKQEEEVEFSPEEQKVYDYGKKDIFKAKPPAKTAKLKSECAELVEHIKTQEQFDSLLAYVRSLPYIKGQIHLKNLVNGLNGWLQPQEAQSTSSSSRQKPSGPFIAQQPTKSREEIDRENEAQIAKYRARVAAIKAKQEAEKQQKTKAS